MKVKCVKIYNEWTKEYQTESPWITIGKEYVVLGIQIRQDEVSFMIINDHRGMPVLANAIQFEVISKKIPVAGALQLETFSFYPFALVLGMKIIFGLIAIITSLMLWKSISGKLV